MKLLAIIILGKALRHQLAMQSKNVTVLEIPVRPCAYTRPVKGELPETNRVVSTWLRSKGHMWWCANRGFTSGLVKAKHLPAHAFYMMIDNDTVVFQDTLAKLLLHIDPFQNLYLGHGFKRQTSRQRAKYFVASGGGVLVSHKTFHKVAKLFDKYVLHQKSKFKWWPLDWVLGEMMHEIGVAASSNSGFQQFSGEPWVPRGACGTYCVACHPYKSTEQQARMLNRTQGDPDLQICRPTGGFISTCGSQRGIAPTRLPDSGGAAKKKRLDDEHRGG